MDIKFKEDENGKILDSDELFNKIDDQIDNDEYDAVVSEILSIPREKWSNKLWFKLICAYNNQKAFDKSEEELDKIEALCDTSVDRAKYHYMRGYICYMNDREILAREHYSDAAKADPEYAGSIDLDSEIKECGDIIAGDLESLHALFGKVCADIKKRCSEKREKIKISDEEFQMRLGFFPGIRKLPGFEHPIGFGDYFSKYEGSEIAKCRQWFENFYGVTDEKSFFDHIQSYGGCNISPMAGDVTAFLSGKPNFDVNDLTEGGRFAFENTVMFVRAFAEYLPKAGVLAWDIGEKIGFARHAYRCGLIGNTEYCRGMLALSDAAKKNFSSWNEYMRSLICGAALFVFNIDQWSISSAKSFVSNMAPLLLMSDLADVNWIK